MTKQKITIAEKRKATFMITVPYKDSDANEAECKVVLDVDYMKGRFSILNHQGINFIFNNSSDTKMCKAVVKAIGQAIDIAEKELNN